MQSNKPRRKTRMGYYRVDDETFGRLAELAVEDERTVSFLVRVAVEEYLDRRKAE